MTIGSLHNDNNDNHKNENENKNKNHDNMILHNKIIQNDNWIFIISTYVTSYSLYWDI